MSAFKNPNFVTEFAYRTKINYFNLRLLQKNGPEETERIKNVLKEIKSEMSSRGFVIDDFYEVTQLINSLIGLLVFPEQAYYDFLSDREEDLETQYPVLYRCVISKEGHFLNTYCEDFRKHTYLIPEKCHPRNIIRHLRNAASHEQIGIFPESGRLLDGTNVIKAITFHDSRDKKSKNGKTVIGKEIFKLTVDIEKLEPLLLEISDRIIQTAR